MQGSLEPTTLLDDFFFPPAGALANGVEFLGSFCFASHVTSFVLFFCLLPPPLPGFANGLVIIWSNLSLGTGLENFLSLTVIFLLSLGSVLWLNTVADESRLMVRAPRKDREVPLLCGSFSGSFFPQRDDVGGARAALAKVAACREGVVRVLLSLTCCPY